jgi:hypothetical protein
LVKTIIKSTTLSLYLLQIVVKHLFISAHLEKLKSKTKGQGAVKIVLIRKQLLLKKSSFWFYQFGLLSAFLERKHFPKV